jgi:hypothetical protein
VHHDLFAFAWSSSLLPWALARRLSPRKHRPISRSCPNVNDIQLGMTNDQVLAKLKALYPAAQGTVVQLSYVKFQKTADKPWLEYVLVTVNPNPCTGQCQEEVRIQFNDPPDEPRAINITRSLGFQPGSGTTVANVRAALIKKYGQPSSPGTAQTLNWIFDEQGNPLKDPKFNGQQCAGIIAYGSPGQGGSSVSNAAPINGALSQLTQADVQKNPCMSGVHVKADIFASGDGLVTTVGVTMSENSFATQAYLHQQAFMQNIVNQEQQQTIKKAQETSAPKL